MLSKLTNSYKENYLSLSTQTTDKLLKLEQYTNEQKKKIAFNKITACKHTYQP